MQRCRWMPARLGVAVAMLALLQAPAVSAHQTGIDLPPGENAVAYFYSDHTPDSSAAPSVWLESNDKASQGVYPSGSASAPMGLQMHPVCYGTFTQADVDNLNQACTYRIFSYVPFNLGGIAACTDLARAIETACNDCGGDLTCRDANDCDEMCDSTDDPCIIAEEFVPADTHVAGATPSYVAGSGCHTGH